MRAWHATLLAAVQASGIAVEPYPTFDAPGNPRGAAASRAYPIQGILKYHGMADWALRTAYMPSVSVNNDAAHTLTWVEFDPQLRQDEATINGQAASGRPLERIAHSLDAVRRVARIKSRARVVSRNEVRATRTGKGLGTSAAASAALAMAAIAAALGERAAENRRFLSCLSRLLAGSGCRSATGGLSLWLSYQGIAHQESYSVRLDLHGEMDDLRLITVPLDSRIGLATEAAHHEAPHSPFFESWMLGRGSEVLECLQAVQRGDWRTIGQLAELDSIRLHGVTMSGSRENKLFAWEPENILLFRLCNTLRDQGAPVYFSTDTGPTTVLITHRDFEEQVVAGIEGLGLELEIIRGKVAGPAELLEPEIAARELGI
jgi:diphosphomevalonate decarboxylase